MNFLLAHGDRIEGTDIVLIEGKSIDMEADKKTTLAIGLHFGAACDPIHKQLTKQGIKVKASDVSHFQRAHDGYVQLRVLGCFGDKQAERIRQQLFNKIAKFCNTLSN